MTATVGARIRDLRVRRGLSQSQLADGLPLASSYVSLIERDLRRPSDQVLALVAVRLGCTVQYLRTGRDGPDVRDLELELRFAELALKSGDARSARDRFDDVARRAGEIHHEDVEQDARWGLSAAEVALGNVAEAIELLEALNGQPELKGAFSRLALACRLAHTHLEAGYIARATEVAETMLAEHARYPDADVDETTELAATLAACYYERGDIGRAQAVIKRILRDAERSDSARARAAAYWQAGVVAEARGDLRLARSHTSRALALYAEIENARAVARLRFNSARLELRLPDPDTASVERELCRAVDELHETSSPADVARAETELARCRLIGLDVNGAWDAASTALKRLDADDHANRARAIALLGQISLYSGDGQSAADHLVTAASELMSCQVSADVAEVWREVGDALWALGLKDEAMNAYRRTADAVGVTPVPVPCGRPVTAAGSKWQSPG